MTRWHSQNSESACYDPAMSYFRHHVFFCTNHLGSRSGSEVNEVRLLTPLIEDAASSRLDGDK